MPGVRAAALGSSVPGAGAGEDDSFTIPEHTITPGTALPDALYRAADPGYFSTLQIPLLKWTLLFERGSHRPSKDGHYQPAAGAAVFSRGKSAGQASTHGCVR